MTSVLIPREAWGARYSNGQQNIILPKKWDENWLHHDVMAYVDENAGIEAEMEHMRSVEAEGQKLFGQGISYTALVFPSGRAFEGHSVDRRGAHTYQRNDRSRAVCLPGNYMNDRVTANQALGVAAVVSEWSDNGWGPNSLSGGHRDVYATLCPGDNAYFHIGTINQLIIEGDFDMAGMTADQAMKLQQTFEQILEVFLRSGGKADFGDVITKLYETFTEIEAYATERTGEHVSAGNVIAQVWDVLGANWTETGKTGTPEMIGKTTADTERKVDELTGLVRGLIASLG